MLTITVLGDELFNDDTQEFVTTPDVVLELEHSLVSLSKWESKFEKPFLSEKTKTEEEVLGYIECMILTPDFAPEVLHRLSQENVEAINTYLGAKMTATWFNEASQPKRAQEIITAELIYFWMFSFSIPIECETWHLNRLFTQIKVHSYKNEKPKKMNSEQQAEERRRLNEQRRAELGSTG